jgi:two-component system cell cycle response regulator
MENPPPISQSELVFARLGKELSATSNAVAAAEIILNAADELIGWDACYLILYDPDQGGRPRPLLAIDTINKKRMIEYDVVPEKPSENMLRAIREDGFLSLYEGAFEISPSLSFGDRRQRTLSQLFVPVRSGARTIGVLSIQSYQLRAYTQNSLETLKTLSNHCAGAMERIWAQEALLHLAERLKVLYQAAHAISASLDMEELCDAIYGTVEKVMPCDDFVIDGYEPATNEIVPIYAIEFPHKRIVTEKYVADHGLAGKIVHTQQPLCFNSITEMNESGINFEFYGSVQTDLAQSILAVPMLLHGKVVGMISAQSYKENAYSHDDQYLLELLASHAAIAIENSRLFTTIQTLADTDPLTGALTRRKFFDMAEREFNRARRYKQRLSVIMLDVDEFKKFNDRFGHQVGDLVLRLVATQCKSSLREMDILGRLGGEEFAVALPGTGLEQAIQVATRLCKLVEEANLTEAGTLFEMSTGERFDKNELKITVSVGVAMYDEACKNIDTLMDHADRAMYSVKHAGRNQISIWKDKE